ncbi:MAG TPA: 2Fe-2S iron-sulfur cluster-binding protein [Devosia sp.]|jgi:aerobic-type carbon monoxide dehydrogenase small subunit (CoxS/CutS family)|uniref:2Fe-2S iron-sulfur cluster-binding protein n=1 Tax=Devosia sp. TaxID=1871048 RepID=UPI002DDCAB36|nr:2Fe-2S iron-sulfur cluster-binding protein [Devosia sp.]HEV2515398.1 2Fe-2S iron-sulfur cluster-binding protein [Devosia sp.]
MSNLLYAFLFDGVAVPFEANETIAAALDRAGIVTLGDGQGGCVARYFCGIGTCQACVVSIDGVRLEACLTPARAGQRIGPVGSGHR